MLVQRSSWFFHHLIIILCKLQSKLMKFCHIYIILHVLDIWKTPSTVSKAISMWFLQERFQMQTKCIEAHENMLQKESGWKEKTGILLPKLFWPTVRKNCSSDREKLWNSRLKTKNMKNFEITRTIYSNSESSEQ